MKAFNRTLLALVLGVAWCGVASADTLVVNCSTVSGPTELASASIVCAQINQKGLTGISISISGGISGSITLTNGGSTATTTNFATTTTQFNVGPLTGFTFVNPVFTAFIGSGPRNLNAGQTLTISGLSGSGNGTLGQNTTSFAPYFGVDFFTIAVSTATSFDVTVRGGSPATAQATNANATAVVTYNYSP